VLSTLHTNSATGAIVRLRDMGVEPFLLSSSLVGIIAQRLLRLLCQHCREGYEVTAQEAARLGIETTEPKLSLFRAKGCSHCNHSGYQGRTAIFEVVAIDNTMRTLIHDGSPEQTLEQRAREHGPSIFADGLRRVLKGDTAIDELLRVTHGG